MTPLLYLLLNICLILLAVIPIGVVIPDYPLSYFVTYKGPWFYIRIGNRLVVGNMRRRHDLPPFNYKRRIIYSLITANLIFLMLQYLPFS